MYENPMLVLLSMKRHLSVAISLRNPRKRSRMAFIKTIRDPYSVGIRICLVCQANDSVFSINSSVVRDVGKEVHKYADLSHWIDTSIFQYIE